MARYILHSDFNMTSVNVSTTNPLGAIHSEEFFFVENDVGLVKSKTSIKYVTGMVGPIALAKAEPSDGLSIKLTGWGLSKNPPPEVTPTSDDLPNTLQQIFLQKIDYVKTCEPKLIDAYVFSMSDTEICTLNGTGKGDCAGDRLVKTKVFITFNS